MAQRQLISPLEQMQMCLNEAQQERSRLMAILCVLVQRQNNAVVITLGELEDLDRNTEILQTEPTAIGFTLRTRVHKPQ